MSDITATNCGCGCDNECNERSNWGLFGGNGYCCSLIWLIILFSCCGCGSGFGLRNGSCGDNSCIWIILLLFFCGGWGGNCGC